MSWSGRPGGRRGYHHGNLREALIAAALDLIAKHGPAGFTFADAARSAGVSSAAPYRHFRDRDALIADVARRGFELFAAHLEPRLERRPPRPLSALSRISAAPTSPSPATSPPTTRRCSRPGCPLDDDPTLRQAGDRAFAVLRNASETLCARLAARKRPPALMMSLHVWALSHGIASLFARGDGGRRRLPMTPEDLLEAGMLIYLHGLGVIAEPPPAEDDADTLDSVQGRVYVNVVYIHMRLP